MLSIDRLAYINAVMAFEVLASKEEGLGTGGAYRTDRERIRDKMKKMARIINLLEEELDLETTIKKSSD